MRVFSACAMRTCIAVENHNHCKSGRFHRNGANEMSRNRRSIDHKGNHYYYIIQRLQENSNGTHSAPGSSWMRSIDICICNRKLEKGKEERPVDQRHAVTRPKKAQIGCRTRSRALRAVAKHVTNK